MCNNTVWVVLYRDDEGAMDTIVAVHRTQAGALEHADEFNDFDPEVGGFLYYVEQYVLGE